MPTDEPIYHFSLKPVTGGRPLESRAGWTAEQMAADFFETRYEPTIGVWGASLPCPVDITLGRDKDGRLAVTALHIDAAKHKTTITATGLRQVGRLVTVLVRRISERSIKDVDHEAWEELLAPLLESLAVPYEGVAVRPGPHGYPPERYQQFAMDYREAVAEDRAHPWRLLVSKWVCVESQARRRVQRARELFPELFKEVDS